MMSEDRLQEVRREHDTWHVVKGIPVAVIIAFLVQTLSMIAVGAWTVRGFVATQERFVESLSSLRTDVAEIKGQFAAFTANANNAAVPSAINQRRIDELEKRALQHEASLAQVMARVAENERRLATETIRARARSER